MFDETVYDTATDAAYLTSVGAVDITPAVGGNLSTLQCASNAGSTLTYSFCYTLTNDPSSTTAYSVVAHGVMQASGPVIRQGRPALTLQSMTGVRVLTANAVVTTQNIVRLVFINGDNDLTNAAILNDNVLYLDATSQLPPVDYFGFVYALSSNAVFPVADLTYDRHQSECGAWHVVRVAGAGRQWIADHPRHVQLHGCHQPHLVPLSVCCHPFSRLQPSTAVSFCYTAQSAQWSLIAQGTLMVYGANITAAGRTALALQSANGTRTYYSANGTVNTVAITGVSAERSALSTTPRTTSCCTHPLRMSMQPACCSHSPPRQLRSLPPALSPATQWSTSQLLSDGTVVEQVWKQRSALSIGPSST